MSVRRVIAVSTMLWMAATAAAFVASPRGATGERQALALTENEVERAFLSDRLATLQP